MLSYTLVTVQILSIVALLVTTPFFALGKVTLWLVLAGILFILYAIAVLRKSKLRMIPDVDKDAVLITAGPYKYIRHPLYLGLIVFCFGLLWSNLVYFRILLFALLVIDLLFKLHYEEELLQKHFPEYKKYMKTTTKLIPFIY